MRCQDTWKKHIPVQKQFVYKRLLDENKIQNIHLTYIRSTGETIVEYDTELSESEVMDLKRRYSSEHGNLRRHDGKQVRHPEA